jgi:hypothetical protein
MKGRKAKGGKELSLDDLVEKQMRDEVRTNFAKTGSWRFPFQRSWKEIIEERVKETGKSEHVIKEEIRRFQKEYSRRALEAHTLEAEMEGIAEELRDFKTFDELVRVLHIVSAQQTDRVQTLIVKFAAEVLEKISKEGYRIPKPSTRQRRGTRKLVQFQWALKGKYMTVEEFKEHVHEKFGIPEGTVLKILYATENPLLKHQARVRAARDR